MDPISEKNRIAARMEACQTKQQLRAVWDSEQAAIRAIKPHDSGLWHQLLNFKELLKSQLMEDKAMAHPGEIPK